ncbi:anti-sigma B factor antagonist [Anaerosphaera aminiphila DSM 21120]|uniref:Anti-sigma factor antagonist n=1 Tax=Anaerosphaera aminiphila DSM 21120 TaxID=1120995 RepID=A0A1M5SC67_9FIRM|nr:STAS domain-containing protein [Anaerosphaera aminiphila]SHH36177.1 anti-sigma B factor antagonist [Anaerosphaera aminiphila DSM 21120]
MAFEINYENKEELIIYPVGELDIYTISEFKEKVMKLYEEDKKNILIDGDKLEYIDSTGLGALIYILNEIEKDNNKIAIRNITNSIRKLFTITKLDNVFEMRS